VDRVVERNEYRGAQIEALAARRAVEGLHDAVVAAVRQALRTLERARQSRRIQEEGVRVAERRVEAATLNLELGRGEIRDRLEAEDALIEARNALTEALVDHAVARLELERDTGTLLPASMLACPAVPGAATVCPPSKP
jgi:outer membrane protein TolC